VFLRLAEKYKDRARFYVLPRVLWDLSFPQVEALKIAERSGKYFELWQRQFARQTPERSGMTVAEIAAQFRELGIDETNLDKRLADVRSTVRTERRRNLVAGINAVPAIYIDRQRVFVASQSEDCIVKLIEQALAEKAAPAR
jgi:predicted DsbA family dithiol-disulfide isomerase